MSRPPRAVLDTNVFLRILLTRKPNGVAAGLWECFERGEFHLVMSVPLLEELLETLLVPELMELHG